MRGRLRSVARHCPSGEQPERKPRLLLLEKQRSPPARLARARCRLGTRRSSSREAVPLRDPHTARAPRPVELCHLTCASCAIRPARDTIGLRRARARMSPGGKAFPRVPTPRTESEVVRLSRTHRSWRTPACGQLAMAASIPSRAPKLALYVADLDAHHPEARAGSLLPCRVLSGRNKLIPSSHGCNCRLLQSHHLKI